MPEALEGSGEEERKWEERREETRREKMGREMLRQAQQPEKREDYMKKSKNIIKITLPAGA